MDVETPESDVEWQCRTLGIPGNQGYRVVFFDASWRPFSAWLDLPLNSSAGDFTVICSSPRGNSQKLEVALTEPFHPLSSDAPDGSVMVYAQPPPCHIGHVVQTWHDPEAANSRLGPGIPGDGKPVCIMDISDCDVEPGAIYSVKALGALAVVQMASAEPSMSWKILGINASDPTAELLKDSDNISRMFPERLEAIKSWLKTCDCVRPGAPPAALGFNSRVQDRAAAMETLATCHQSWQLLTESLGSTLRPQPWESTDGFLDDETLASLWAAQLKLWNKQARALWTSKLQRRPLPPRSPGSFGPPPRSPGPKKAGSKPGAKEAGKQGGKKVASAAAASAALSRSAGGAKKGTPAERGKGPPRPKSGGAGLKVSKPHGEGKGVTRPGSGEGRTSLQQGGINGQPSFLDNLKAMAEGKRSPKHGAEQSSRDKGAKGTSGFLGALGTSKQKAPTLDAKSGEGGKKWAKTPSPRGSLWLSTASPASEKGTANVWTRQEHPISEGGWDDSSSMAPSDEASPTSSASGFVQDHHPDLHFSCPDLMDSASLPEGTEGMGWSPAASQLTPKERMLGAGLQDGTASLSEGAWSSRDLSRSESREDLDERGHESSTSSSGSRHRADTTSRTEIGSETHWADLSIVYQQSCTAEPARAAELHSTAERAARAEDDIVMLQQESSPQGTAKQHPSVKKSHLDPREYFGDPPKAKARQEGEICSEPMQQSSSPHLEAALDCPLEPLESPEIDVDLYSEKGGTSLCNTPDAGSPMRGLAGGQAWVAPVSKGSVRKSRLKAISVQVRGAEQQEEDTTDLYSPDPLLEGRKRTIGTKLSEGQSSGMLAREGLSMDGVDDHEDANNQVLGDPKDGEFMRGHHEGRDDEQVAISEPEDFQITETSPPRQEQSTSLRRGATAKGQTGKGLAEQEDEDGRKKQYMGGQQSLPKGKVHATGREAAERRSRYDGPHPGARKQENEGRMGEEGNRKVEGKEDSGDSEEQESEESEEEEQEQEQEGAQVVEDNEEEDMGVEARSAAESSDAHMEQGEVEDWEEGLNDLGSSDDSQGMDGEESHGGLQKGRGVSARQHNGSSLTERWVASEREVGLQQGRVPRTGSALDKQASAGQQLTGPTVNSLASRSSPTHARQGSSSSPREPIDLGELYGSFSGVPPPHPPEALSDESDLIQVPYQGLQHQAHSGAGGTPEAMMVMGSSGATEWGPETQFLMGSPLELGMHTAGGPVLLMMPNGMVAVHGHPGSMGVPQYPPSAAHQYPGMIMMPYGPAVPMDATGYTAAAPPEFATGPGFAGGGAYVLTTESQGIPWPSAVAGHSRNAQADPEADLFPVGPDPDATETIQEELFRSKTTGHEQEEPTASSPTCMPPRSRSSGAPPEYRGVQESAPVATDEEWYTYQQQMQNTAAAHDAAVSAAGMMHPAIPHYYDPAAFMQVPGAAHWQPLSTAPMELLQNDPLLPSDPLASGAHPHPMLTQAYEGFSAQEEFSAPGLREASSVPHPESFRYVGEKESLAAAPSFSTMLPGGARTAVESLQADEAAGDIGTKELSFHQQPSPAGMEEERTPGGPTPGKLARPATARADAGGGGAPEESSRLVAAFLANLKAGVPLKPTKTPRTGQEQGPRDRGVPEVNPAREEQSGDGLLAQPRKSEYCPAGPAPSEWTVEAKASASALGVLVPKEMRRESEAQAQVKEKTQAPALGSFNLASAGAAAAAVAASAAALATAASSTISARAAPLVPTPEQQASMQAAPTSSSVAGVSSTFGGFAMPAFSSFIPSLFAGQGPVSTPEKASVQDQPIEEPPAAPPSSELQDRARLQRERFLQKMKEKSAGAPAPGSASDPSPSPGTTPSPTLDTSQARPDGDSGAEGKRADVGVKEDEKAEAVRATGEQVLKALAAKAGLRDADRAEEVKARGEQVLMAALMRQKGREAAAQLHKGLTGDLYIDTGATEDGTTGPPSKASSGKGAKSPSQRHLPARPSAGGSRSPAKSLSASPAAAAENSLSGPMPISSCAARQGERPEKSIDDSGLSSAAAKQGARSQRKMQRSNQMPSGRTRPDSSLTEDDESGRDEEHGEARVGSLSRRRSGMGKAEAAALEAFASAQHKGLNLEPDGRLEKAWEEARRKEDEGARTHSPAQLSKFKDLVVATDDSSPELGPLSVRSASSSPKRGGGGSLIKKDLDTREAAVAAALQAALMASPPKTRPAKTGTVAPLVPMKELAARSKSPFPMPTFKGAVEKAAASAGNKLHSAVPGVLTLPPSLAARSIFAGSKEDVQKGAPHQGGFNPPELEEPAAFSVMPRTQASTTNVVGGILVGRRSARPSKAAGPEPVRGPHVEDVPGGPRQLSDARSASAHAPRPEEGSTVSPAGLAGAAESEPPKAVLSQDQEEEEPLERPVTLERRASLDPPKPPGILRAQSFTSAAGRVSDLYSMDAATPEPQAAPPGGAASAAAASRFASCSPADLLFQAHRVGAPEESGQDPEGSLVQVPLRTTQRLQDPEGPEDAGNRNLGGRTPSDPIGGPRERLRGVVKAVTSTSASAGIGTLRGQTRGQLIDVGSLLAHGGKTPTRDADAAQQRMRAMFMQRKGARGGTEQ